jgi:NAD+ kinase
MCSAANMHELLPRVLRREVEPVRRTRIQTIIKSTFTETKLPPALNDILVAHPSPAAVSR